jgi:membrane associated rhomboid family serine protease
MAPSEDKNKSVKTDGFDLDRILAQVSAEVYEKWDETLKKLEGQENKHVKWITANFLRKLSVEAPVIVSYVFACVFLHILNITIAPGISRWLGVRDAFSPFQPMQYLRLVTHIFGHENMAHLRGNMTHILMVGPSAEEVFGSQNMVFIMLAVAISSGFGHIVLGPTNTSQIGASGIVFALILVNSLVSAKVGRIPISFVLTAMLWTSDEMWGLLFANDQISHSAHLIGAAVGTAAGYYIQSGKTMTEMEDRAGKWNLMTKMKKKGE